MNANRRKSSQVGGQTKRKLSASPNLRRLASPFGQGFKMKKKNGVWFAVLVGQIWFFLFVYFAESGSSLGEIACFL